MVTEVVSLIGMTVVALGSGLIPAILEGRRAKRQRISNEQESIRQAAATLLRNLANFRHTLADNQAEASGFASYLQATAEMRGAYDAWALTVMPRLNASQQERVRKIRQNELGRDNLRNTEGQDISMSKEIFELTWTARGNVR